jgi:hypothetical protein
VRTRIVLGKTEIALRPLYDRRQRMTGLVPISSAEPNTLDGPVRVETGLGGFALDDDAGESLAIVVGLLDSLCDCGLQKVARNRASVIGRFRAFPNVHTPHPKYMVMLYGKISIKSRLERYQFVRSDGKHSLNFRSCP